MGNISAPIYKGSREYHKQLTKVKHYFLFYYHIYLYGYKSDRIAIKRSILHSSGFSRIPYTLALEKKDR